MTTKIPTKYTDKFGSVDTEILNDFETLTITLEGVKFVGKQFDDFSPVDFESLPSRFKLNDFRELTDCSLLCKIPMIAVQNKNEIPVTFVVDIYIDTEKEYSVNCHFSLLFDDSLIEIGNTQHFESAFEILKDKLPSDTYLKCCYNCLYADYNFAGSSIFGNMFCFKNIKDKYLTVQTKDEYIDIFELNDKQVQEIYLSENFERRINGTGYRG